MALDRHFQSPPRPRLSFTTRTVASRVMSPAEKQRFWRRVNSAKKVMFMGDKSPKSNQKKATQKQSKASSADQKKKDAVAAKQAFTKKN